MPSSSIPYSRLSSNPSPQPPPAPSKFPKGFLSLKNVPKILAIILLLSILTYLVYDTFLGPHIIWDELLSLNKWIEKSGSTGPIYLSIILTILTLLGIPATIFIIGGGFAFTERFGTLGMLYNFVACYLGCTVGGCCAFFLGRYFFRERVRTFIRKRKMRIVRAIDIAMKKEGERGERGGLANYTER